MQVRGDTVMVRRAWGRSGLNVRSGIQSWSPVFVTGIGASPSGKAADFDSAIRRFESSRPSQCLLGIWLEQKAPFELRTERGHSTRLHVIIETNAGLYRFHCVRTSWKQSVISRRKWSSERESMACQPRSTPMGAGRKAHAERVGAQKRPRLGPPDNRKLPHTRLAPGERAWLSKQLPDERSRIESHAGPSSVRQALRDRRALKPFAQFPIVKQQNTADCRRRDDDQERECHDQVDVV